MTKRTLAEYAQKVRQSDLLAKLCILALCLIYALPNISTVRTLYYFVILPIAALTLRGEDLKKILASRLFLAVAAYFAVFAIAAPFAQSFSFASFVEFIRSSLLVLSFLAIVAYLVRRDPDFPDNLFVYLSVIAAVVAVRNILEFYGGLPPFNKMPTQMEGVFHVTMYYNPNWVASMYGIACVGAAAAVARPGRSRSMIALLVGAATILFAAVVLTQSRSVLIGTLLGLAIVTFMIPYRLRPSVRRAIQMGMALIAVMMIMPFIESFVSRGDSNRFLIWQAYLDYVWAHPWIGSGLKTVLPVTVSNGFETTHPHNIIYQALLRGGVFAAACLVVVIVLLCLQSIRAWQKTGSSLFLALVVAALLPLQLEFTVVVGTSVGWDWLTLWLPIALCIGANIEQTNT